MNPVAYTYDWGLTTDIARRNQNLMIGQLGVEHIIRSPDLSQKRKNVRANINAWLKRPELGMVPIFMSGDKDFIHLQKHSFVKQYSPTLKKYVNGVDPYQYRAEHIFRGDRGDGIPNILSPDDTFVENKRQKPLGKKKVQEWLSKGAWPIEDWQEEVKRNYQRNKTLIDFECVPDDIFKNIHITWVEYKKGDKSKILPYFMKHRLRELTERLGDF